MAAVLGLDAQAIEVALAGMNDAWPANYNTPTQTVIAGTMTGLEVATQRLQVAGAKRVIPLNVSAAFHTPLMAPAAERLRAALDRIEAESSSTDEYAFKVSLYRSCRMRRSTR